MRVSDLERFYDYNYWATKKLFEIHWRDRRKLRVDSQYSRAHHERRVGLARSLRRPGNFDYLFFVGGQ